MLLQMALFRSFLWPSNLPDVQAGFRKCRGTKDQIANISWIIEKPREFQKLIYFCFIDYAKAFDCGKHLKRWEYQITLPASWEICMQVKKKQLDFDMEQRTGSKLEKEYVKAAYCHPGYLIYMQNILCKIQGWMKQKLESRLPAEISITTDKQMTPPSWWKAKTNWRVSLWKWQESEKAGLKLNIQKTMIMAFSPITSWQIGGKTGSSDWF